MIKLPCFNYIMHKTRKHLVDDLDAQRRMLDRERQIDAAIKVTRHPISAGKEHFGLAGILKIKNSAMLKKTTHNADDADIVAQAGHFWPQTTDASNDQIDGHIRARSFVQLLDDLLIDQCAEFRNDA